MGVTVDQVFTSERMMRLTGVSRRRLAYWLDRGIVSADVDAAKGRGRVRLWSFSNLVEVRVALALRDEVSLQLLGKIVRKLRERGMTLPLSQVRIAVDRLGSSSRVVIQESDGSWAEPLSGQGVMILDLPLDQYGRELVEAAERDRKTQRREGLIEQRRGRLGSAPVFAGTRVPVATVKRLLDAGWGDERILAEYPGLTRADLRVAAGAKSKAS
jgi:uncharacterized protein (DUF433 family)